MYDSIMYIDDTEFEHYIVESLVKSSNCRIKIRCFFKATEALDFLVKNKDDALETPDVIFLDLAMPGFTGWDFLDEFDKIRLTFFKQPKVCILSSSVDMDSINRSGNYSFINPLYPSR
jgi:CheY-like chemotaxis protein